MDLRSRSLAAGLTTSSSTADIIVAGRSVIAAIGREVAGDTVMRLRAHRARMQQYVTDVKAGKFSNEWVDRQLSADQCQVE